MLPKALMYLKNLDPSDLFATATVKRDQELEPCPRGIPTFKIVLKRFVKVITRKSFRLCVRHVRRCISKGCPTQVQHVL